MKTAPNRYTARMFGGGDWRVWGREDQRWIGASHHGCPDEFLRTLNGPPARPPHAEPPLDADPRSRRIPLSFLALAGADLGAPTAVWLPLPAPPGPGEAGGGLEALGAVLFGPFLGALAGGLLGLVSGLVLSACMSGGSR